MVSWLTEIGNYIKNFRYRRTRSNIYNLISSEIIEDDHDYEVMRELWGPDVMVTRKTMETLSGKEVKQNLEDRWMKSKGLEVFYVGDLKYHVMPNPMVKINLTTSHVMLDEVALRGFTLENGFIQIVVPHYEVGVDDPYYTAVKLSIKEVDGPTNFTIPPNDDVPHEMAEHVWYKHGDLSSDEDAVKV